MRRGAAAALAAGLLLPLTALPASADGVDDLPEISSAELADSVHDLDLAVGDLDPEVGDLDIADSVSDVERKASSGSIALNSDILFGFDKDTLSARAKKAVVEAVEDVPDGASVSIDGYTDDVGEDAYNVKLSDRRATAVEDAITQARPDLDTTAEGHGSADPVAPNREGGEDNPEGRARNRRVEITVD